MPKLTIQANLSIDSTAIDNITSKWLDIAIIEFDDDKQITAFTYLDEHCQHFLADNHHAVSINYPVDFFSYHADHNWFAFLDDMIPAGASRRYWLQRLDLSRLSVAEQNYQLLKRATIAPIGHLRIKEAISHIQQSNIQQKRHHTPKLFDMADVINRDIDFLEYANEQGAIAGGATGAGGEAPKLVLRYAYDKSNNDKSNNDKLANNKPEPKDLNNAKVWIDNQQLANNTDLYYLVKYPRGKRSERDCDILRAEFYYYHQLAEMGFNTIDTTQMKLIEGENYPSLWLPRFDVQTSKNGTKRYAMESVYSMLQKGAGAYLDHEESIRKLIEIIENSNMVREGYQFDKQAFVIEWVQRDLLNMVFGNSDNHGRNTAFLRDDKRIWLAPIYDFAPMKADPEGIVRTMKWQSPIESGGNYRFDLLVESLADLVEPTRLLNELQQTAQQVTTLKSDLADKGVPDSILNYPAIGFDYLTEKLQRWGLLS